MTARTIDEMLEALNGTIERGQGNCRSHRLRSVRHRNA